MLWNAVALRFSQRDFKGRQHDGVGEDWPLDYADMTPYYDRVEREVGVCGNYDHLDDLPDGVFLPPVPMKCTDIAIQERCGEVRRQSHSCSQSHFEPRARPLGPPATSAATACPAATWSPNTIPTTYRWCPRLKTGKLTLVSNSIVHEFGR